MNILKYCGQSIYDTDVWVEGYPIIINGIDETDPDNPKEFQCVYIFTEDLGTELIAVGEGKHKIVNLRQVQVDPKTVRLVSDMTKDVN